MSRSSYDFNFKYADKPCGYRGFRDQNIEDYKCCDNASQACPFFQMCDLPIKNPPTPPTVDWRNVTKLTFG